MLLGWQHHELQQGGCFPGKENGAAEACSSFPSGFCSLEHEMQRQAPASPGLVQHPARGIRGVGNFWRPLCMHEHVLALVLALVHVLHDASVCCTDRAALPGA